MRTLGSIFILVSIGALTGGWLGLAGGIGSDLKLTLMGVGFLISGAGLFGSGVVADGLGRLHEEARPLPPVETADPAPDSSGEDTSPLPAIRRPGFHRRAA